MRRIYKKPAIRVVDYTELLLASQSGLTAGCGCNDVTGTAGGDSIPVNPDDCEFDDDNAKGNSLDWDFGW